MKQKWNEEWFRGKREELKAGGGPLPRPMSPTMEMVGIRPENKNYLVGTRHLLPVQSRLVLQLVQAMVDSTRDTVFMPQVDDSSKPDSSPGETWAVTAQDDSLPRESLWEPSLVAAATASAAGSCSGSDAAAPATEAAGHPNGHMALLE
ncbi:uncharacterized protein LOC144164067 isoform X1 [Haemaphysalis longicornis]